MPVGSIGPAWRLCDSTLMFDDVHRVRRPGSDEGADTSGVFVVEAPNATLYKEERLAAGSYLHAVSPHEARMHGQHAKQGRFSAVIDDVSQFA